jgi:hypothetical protein
LSTFYLKRWKDLFESLSLDSPSYIRIPKGSGLKHDQRCITNRDVLVLTYGSTGNLATEYAISKDFDYRVLEKLKPFPHEEIAFHSYKEIIVVEDRFPTIGLYSMVCQVINETRAGVYVQSISPRNYCLTVGHHFQDFLE